MISELVESASTYAGDIDFLILLIGVLVSVAVIGFTIIAMHNSPMGPIGSEKLPAPQGTLMATIIQGVLSRDLPWVRADAPARAAASATFWRKRRSV